MRDEQAATQFKSKQQQKKAGVQDKGKLHNSLSDIMSNEMLKSTQVIFTEIDRLDQTISLSGKSMQVQP